MKKQYWLAFFLNGKEIFAYTLEGTFPEEKENTIELLAYEKNVSTEDIKTKIIFR